MQQPKAKLSYTPQYISLIQQPTKIVIFIPEVYQQSLIILQTNMSVTINVVSAQLTRDTQTFSNMDPYCILKLGSQSQRTRTKNEAGKKPVWNEMLRFTNADNQLKVIVMDEDNVSDDTVGEGDTNITQYRNSPTEQQVIVQLYYKGRAAGKVLLRITGAGNGQGGNQWAQNNTWGNTQPNNQYGNQNYGTNPYGNQANQWGQQGNQYGGNNGYGQQPPQPNPYAPTQPNSGWGQQGGNGWGQQINSWNQTNPNQGYQQPPNQYNQPPPIQGQNNWNQPPPNQGQNTWNQPPNNQWGGNTQGQQGWNKPPIVPPVVPPIPPSQPVNPNQNLYPDLEYKPPINNNNPYAQGGNTGYGTTPPPNVPGSTPPNMNIPYQLIGGMQGLLANNNTQPSNPYYK